jgi:hypothetical protein
MRHEVAPRPDCARIKRGARNFPRFRVADRKAAY